METEKDGRVAMAKQRIRSCMGHALKAPETRLAASRETFSSPAAEIELVDAAAHIAGSELVFKRIAEANGVGDLLDFTTELRNARIFDQLAFIVRSVPPSGTSTPDLLVSRDCYSAYVEGTRVRPPHLLSPPPVLRHEEERQRAQSVRTLEQEIRDKFCQARAANGDSIIAVWNDRDFVEASDFRWAIQNIRQSPGDPDDSRPIPEQLLFCLFGSFWINGGTGQQIYVEPLRALDEPHLTWIKELEQVHL